MNNTIKIILIFATIIFFPSCKNNEQLDKSRNKESFETEEITKEKEYHQKEIDSLKNKIAQLKKKKKGLLSQHQIDLLKTDIYYILQESQFDHLIIGANDLGNLTNLFEKLGFSVKTGKQHTNGIKNNFIEFNDNSEIELIEINNSSDNLSNEYQKLISSNISGLQFALRVNQIDELRDAFNKLKSDFTNFEKNPVYAALSKNELDVSLPLFFINYNKNNNNLTVHPNGSKGIYSIWFSTKDIKNTAKQLNDFGFKVMGNYNLPVINKKSILLKNNNFKIVLIKSDLYEITGLTILVDDLQKIKDINKSGLNADFIEFSGNRGKSIFVNKQITHSIWIEFLSEIN